MVRVARLELRRRGLCIARFRAYQKTVCAKTHSLRCSSFPRQALRAWRRPHIEAVSSAPFQMIKGLKQMLQVFYGPSGETCPLIGAAAPAARTRALQQSTGLLLSLRSRPVQVSP